jgi:hypothetical protein
MVEVSALKYFRQEGCRRLNLRIRQEGMGKGQFGFEYGIVFAVAEVIGHLRFQRFLVQRLRELLEQPVLANQVFRLSVISQQAVRQLLGYGFLRYGHHRSWQCGSFLPVDRLHKNSYTLDCRRDLLLTRRREFHASSRIGSSSSPGGSTLPMRTACG